MILPECRWMWEGIEGADSLVVNAHKWLGAPFDCSLYYVRDPEHLMRVMSTNPSFLQSSVDGQVKNLRDWGIPLGRRFRALKLWFLIREQGVAGLQARLRRDMANARALAETVAATPGWRVLAPVHLQTVCVRHEPVAPDGKTLAGEALDQHTTGLGRGGEPLGRGLSHAGGSSTAAGWRGSPSAPWRRKRRTSPRFGPRCRRRPKHQPSAATSPRLDRESAAGQSTYSPRRFHWSAMKPRLSTVTESLLIRALFPMHSHE